LNGKNIKASRILVVVKETADKHTTISIITSNITTTLCFKKNVTLSTFAKTWLNIIQFQ